MKLSVGGNHAGFPLKATIIEVCRSLGHDVTDHGCHDTSPVDFPDITRAVCADVVAARQSVQSWCAAPVSAPRSPRTSCVGIVIQRVAAAFSNRMRSNSAHLVRIEQVCVPILGKIQEGGLVVPV